MRRTRLAWLILALCLAVVLSALGWIAATLLKLDRADAAARQQTALEENVRLALWRLDARAATWVVRLDALPAWEHPDGGLPAGEVPLVKGFFVSDGARWKASAGLAFTPPYAPLLARARQTAPPAAAGGDEQAERHAFEAGGRADLLARAGGRRRWFGLWHDGQLLLAGVDAAEVTAPAPLIVGAVLDWPACRAELQQAGGGLLAGLALSPAAAATPGARQLAVLPVRLETSGPGFFYVQPASPLKLMLLVAWSCMLLPAIGVAILLAAAVSLNERRGAFVSAVTHELRTPLTTFRMYTEMLDEGMVPPDKRPQYVATLRREAARLSHLVENVLTYARLERGRFHETLETVALAGLLERAGDELRQRAQRAGMTIEMTPPAAGLLVGVDTAAVERILVNLVDNACKYAAGAADRRIRLETATAGGMVLLTVRDFGPGVARGAERKLFRAFSKSDREAAQSAAGVGLGLALSRRLARRLGGELRLDPSVRPGACFRLSLPVAGSDSSSG